MQGLRLATYTLWANQRAARVAMEMGDVPTVEQCVHAIRQVENTTRFANLRRACQSARRSIARTVVDTYGITARTVTPSEVFPTPDPKGAA
jgi:hypothetical protein